MPELLTRDDCRFDVDHHGPEFAADPVAVTNRARARCPITWSSTHGGFWHVTGWNEVFEILQDDELYVSSDGVSIPPMKKKGPPIDVDPPEHKLFRNALGRHTSRGGVEFLAGPVRQWTVEAIESVLDAGHCDLVTDIGSPVPAKAIMTLLGLPLDRWRQYADVWHEVLAHPQDDAVYRELQDVRDEVFTVFESKRGCPVTDAMSALWSSELMSEAHPCPAGFTDRRELGGEISMTLLGAGVDTTTNMFAQAVLWLAQHPAERARLAEDPGLRKNAVDEFFRFFSTAPALARTVARDTELFGHRLQAGDRVLVSFLGANHDPRAYDHPERLQIDRYPVRHMAFGVGRHRCMGSHLARLVFPIMLEELLARLPDFEVDTARCVPYADRGQVSGWANVPLVFPVRVGG